MIPLVYVGYAFGAVLLTLGTIVLYEVGKDVWDAGGELIDDTRDTLKIVGGASLLLLALFLMSKARRK